MQTGMGLLLAGVLALGIAVMLGTIWESAPAKIVVSAISAVLVGAAGFVLVELIYAPHCHTVLPFVQRPFAG
jgi:hypothetical protein